MSVYGDGGSTYGDLFGGGVATYGDFGGTTPPPPAAEVADADGGFSHLITIGAPEADPYLQDDEEVFVVAYS